MIEVPEELIEAMHRRQVLVAIAEMVLAELAGRVTEALEHLRDGHVFGLDPQGGAGHADLGQARADRLLAGEERRTASGAALLAVEVREHRALAGDAIHVRRAIAHEAVVVAAQIEPADVVRHDEENVRLARLCHVSPPVRLVTPRAVSDHVRARGLTRTLAYSNTTFQSFFMLTTVHRCAFASSRDFSAPAT